eukprot:3423722-Prymnesium_polylepis.1
MHRSRDGRGDSLRDARHQRLRGNREAADDVLDHRDRCRREHGHVDECRLRVPDHAELLQWEDEHHAEQRKERKSL